jgi:hypothetical protein
LITGFGSLGGGNGDGMGNTPEMTDDLEVHDRHRDRDKARGKKQCDGGGPAKFTAE